MINKKILIVGLLFVFALVAWLFYPKNLHKKPANFKRTIVNRDLKKVKRIDTYHVIMSLAEYKQNLFMNRMLDIVSLNPDGDITDTFQVSDPHYLSNNFLVGLDIDSTGIYFQDTQNRTFTKMGFDKKVLYQKKLNSPLLRSVLLQNNSFLLKTVSLSDNYANPFFELYHPEDSSASAVIDTLIPHFGKGALTSDGQFVKNNNGEVLHYFYYMSRIFWFDKFGKPLTAFNTIDGNNLPPPVIKTTTGYTLSPEAHVIHSAAFADDTHLYISSNIRSADISEEDFENNYVIDVYDIRKGQYENSFFLPRDKDNMLSSMLIKDGNIYAVAKNRYLTIYK